MALRMVGSGILSALRRFAADYKDTRTHPHISRIWNCAALPHGPETGATPVVTIQFLVYPATNFGLSAGYKRYQLSLDDTGTGVAIDLVWDGFIVGVQYRF